MRTEKAETQTETLRGSELSYRRLFEAARDGILILDVDTGRITDVNPFLIELLGFSHDEMIGKTVGKLSPFKDILSNQVMLERLQRDGYIRYEDLPLETRAGQRVSVEFVSNVYQAGDKKVIQCNIRDITERKRTEGAMFASEARYRRLFEAAKDGILILNAATGRIVDVNPYLTDLLGFSHETFIGKHLWELGLFKDIAANEAHFKELQAKDYIRYDDLPLETSNGRRIDVEFVSNTYNVDGHRVMQCNIRDITKRKAAEMGMSRLGAIVESSEDAIIGEDLDGIITSWNKGAETTFGYTAAELAGTSIMRLIPAARQEEEIQIQGKIKRGENVGDLETLRQTKDGRLVHVWVTASPIKNAAGKIVGVSKILRDITERKRTSEALRSSEQRYRTLVETARDFIFTISSQGVVKSLNPEFFTATGWTPDECIGQSYERLIQAGDLPRAQELFGRALHGVALPVFELCLNRRDGGPMPTEFTIATRAENGQVVELLGIGRDITERKRAEEEQAFNQAILTTQQETSPDAILLVDENAHIISYNQRFVKMWGLPADMVASGNDKPVLQRVTSQVANPEAFQARVQYLYEHKTEKGHTEILLKNGRIIERYSAPMCSPEGRYYGRAWFFHDITEQKQAEEVLRQRVKLQDQLVHTAAAVPGMIYSLRLRPDGSTQMPYASGALSDIFDLRPEEVIKDAAPIFSLIHPDDLGHVQATMAESARTLNPWRDEFRAHHTRLGEIWVEGHSVPQREADGSILWHGFVQDITERKRAEASLARLATAVEQSAETIVITDTDAKILYANPAFEKTTGYTRAEALGQNPRILNSGKQDAGFYPQMWDVLTRGEVWHGHFVNKRKDGKLYEEEATISPIRDAGGKVINYVAVKRDVTREVELEAQFRQAQKIEAIGTLAGGVAHDFNNILAVIQMQADMLKIAGDLSAAQSELANDIGCVVKRGAALTRQLLMFSRKEVLQLRDLDLNQNVTDMTKMLTRILGENIAVQLKLAAQPMLLHADAGMMDQVLMNLAVNARDAMLNGGQLVIETAGVEFDEFAATQTAQARPGSFVRLSVSDYGCGIPPENLSKIFEPFFTTKGVGKGTGLGLATVFGIAQQHHGWVNVHSEVGQGTTFKVYLPRLAESHDTTIIRKMPATAQTGHETILLVEDEPSLRTTIQFTLSRLGYRVMEASTGFKALEVWKEHPGEIHLLLTDLMMPDGMTGKDLGQRLFQENPKLKVIYMSGYSADIVAKDFPLQEGVNFLAKPFAAQKLAQTIRQSLDAPAIET